MSLPPRPVASTPTPEPPQAATEALRAQRGLSASWPFPCDRCNRTVGCPCITGVSEFEMSPYRELLDLLDGLPLLVRETRRRRQLSMRKVAELTGVTAPTIQRCEAGEQEVSLTNAKRLLRWLATPDPVTTTEGEETP